MRTKKALIAGTLACDVVPDFPESAARREDLLVEGRNVYLTGISFRLGGLVANTGIAMCRLGADVVLASRVGDNPFGRAVEEMLRERCPGVPCHTERTNDRETSATIVINFKNSDRIFWHCSGASQDYRFENLPARDLAEADLLHFGYPNGMPFVVRDGGVRLAELYRRVKDVGLTTSLDTSLPALESESGRADWRPILARILPHVDVFAPSIEETLFMLRRDYYLDVLVRAGDGNKLDHIDLGILGELAEEIMSHGVKVCVLKLGKFGIYLRTAKAEAFDAFGRVRDALPDTWFGRELLEPAFKVGAMHSTNGAGDTAIAGLLTGMLSGCPPEECIGLAMGAAAFRIGSPLGVEGVPSMEDVFELIRAGWPKEPVGQLPATWRKTGDGQRFLGACDYQAGEGS